MKKLLRLVIAGILIALGAGAVLLPPRMETSVRSALGRRAVIQLARWSFPLGVRLTGITIPAVQEGNSPLTLQEILIRPVLDPRAPGWLGMVLEVTHPKRELHWRPEGKELPPAPFLQEGKGFPLQVTSVRVHGAELTLMDETVQPAVTWRLRDGEAQLQRGSALQEYLYQMEGHLHSGTGERIGTLRVEASLLIQGPVQAKVFLEHRKLEELQTYLRQVLGTAPSRGTIQVRSSITLQQGVLLSHNELEAEGVRFPDEEPTLLGPSGNRLVELLTSAEGKVRFKFLVTGKLGEQLDWSDLTAGAMRESIQQAMARGIQKVLQQSERGTPVERRLQQEQDSLGR